MVLFVTCFAIAGSRVSLTGGLYAYVEVAFGRYVGFLAGMLYFLTALGAVAGVVNVLANSVALVVPFLGGPVMRIIVMFAVYGSLVLINIRGVREGAGAVTVITVAKLLPLLLFICVGTFFYSHAESCLERLAEQQVVRRCRYPFDFRFRGDRGGIDSEREVKPGTHSAAVGVSGAGDYDNHLPDDPARRAGHARSRSRKSSGCAARLNRRRHSSAPGPRWSFWPGASISAFGFVTSDILSSPRMIFAFGRDGALPQFFAHVHPRYRSPDVAIVTYAALAFALSISGTFERLAVLSNVAVLLMYLLCCAACWVLVQRDVRSDGKPFNFSWNENCACAGDPRHRLDSRARHRSRIPRDWNRAGAVVSFLFCVYGVSPESVGKRQKPISFPPCATLSRGVLFVPTVSKCLSTDTTQHKEELVGCADWLVNKLTTRLVVASEARTYRKRHPIVWARNEHRPGCPKSCNDLTVITMCSHRILWNFGIHRRSSLS